jgi:hypothetical protein
VVTNGVVDFYDGNTPLGLALLDANGQATVDVTAGGVGTAALRAVLRSGNFPASTSAVVGVTVNRAATAVALTPSVNPAAPGQSVTFTATVTAVAPGAGTPTGTVTFLDGATVLGSAPVGAGNQATFMTSFATTGGHAITAVYNGDGNLAGSSQSLTEQVNSAAPPTPTPTPSPTPTATATYLRQDATTQGTWMGTYGSQGYDVIDGSSSLPSYATVTPSGQSNYVWASPTTDVRALQTAGGSSRIAATWYTGDSGGTSFTVDVNLTDGRQHDLELYFLDWDNLGRSEQVQISDAISGAVLSTQSVSSFSSGVYLDYAVSGNVVITITNLAGKNAVLSGLFLDPATTATATYLRQDATTQGTWMGTYGSQGYDVIDGSSSLPGYASITPSGQSNYVWASPTTDVRALQTAGGSSRIAATWYSATSFTVDVDLSDGRQHDLELYFLDWDNLGRSEQVQISDATSGAVLSTQSISSFSSGVYLDYAVSGHIVITLTRQAGANAVLSGLFLG